MSRRCAGIDVGARRLDCVLLDGDGSLAERRTIPADEPGRLRAWCGKAAVVAIDAPAAPSTAPHAHDRELAPKFRVARCAEIELGRRHGAWVSWVAPPAPPFPPWMESGFAVFEALRGRGGPELLEVYPFAGFRALAGGRALPRKQTADGRRARAQLLARAGVSAVDAGLSHDLLDACLAAVVARDRADGTARRVTCGHDGSAIWLPAPID